MRIHARRGRLLVAVGVLLAVVGVITTIVALRAQQEAPQPPAAAASPVEVHADTTTPLRAPARKSNSTSSSSGPKSFLPPSEPVRLQISSIHVDSAIHPVGLNPDGSVEVPPLQRDSWAGWYDHSPTPGQIGPSILLGHVDSAAYGPAVFFRLGQLRQRDRILVTRADHTVAVFEVERVISVPKDHFPTVEVYGTTDHPALRLITCGGKFDLSSHNYENNIVAFASLVSTQQT